MERGGLLRRYSVSTASNGAGELSGSHCTPRGRHVVRAKIGAGAASNTVFRGRRPTGEIWTPQLAEQFPDRDWMLTRILWLSGKEPGRNRLGNVDTMRRYIYLHGSPDTAPMGRPGSIGCVRMRNRDIIELFDLVPPYTPVDIVEFGVEAGDWTAWLRRRAVREAVFVGSRRCRANSSSTPTTREPPCGGTRCVTARRSAPGACCPTATSDAWRCWPTGARKGVGRALLEGLLEEAAASGMTQLALHAQTTASAFIGASASSRTAPNSSKPGCRTRPCGEHSDPASACGQQAVASSRSRAGRRAARFARRRNAAGESRIRIVELRVP
jgi:L,D-transpeptidase YbiS